MKQQQKHNRRQTMPKQFNYFNADVLNKLEFNELIEMYVSLIKELQELNHEVENEKQKARYLHSFIERKFGFVVPKWESWSENS